MSWVPAEGGKTYPDGNDTEYPVLSPSNDNKLYKESDVNNIALAIGDSDLKVADMASAISSMSGNHLLCQFGGNIRHVDMGIHVYELE